MQKGTFGKAMRYLVALGTLVSSLAMFACGGGSNNTNVSNTVGLTSSTVVGVQGVPFIVPNGQLFDPGLSGAATLTFNSANTFSVVGIGGGTASGLVSFSSSSGATVGSCTFTFQANGGLFVGLGTVTIPSCSLLITANDVEPGGGQVNGSVTLSLGVSAGTVNSNALTIPVKLGSNSELFLVNPAGQTVDMGIVV
jgi:hypothetical protein